MLKPVAANRRLQYPPVRRQGTRSDDIEYDVGTEKCCCGLPGTHPSLSTDTS